MRKGLIITVLVCSIMLVGCNPKGDNLGMKDNKIPFYIKTVSIQDLSSGSQIKKTGKIVGSQDIIVSSQASGRVKNIESTIGDVVSKGEKIITLEDSTGVYTFAAQRAGTSVKQARLNYEQTIVSLDKAITDTKQAIKQAENQAKNSALGLGDSSAELQMRQLQSQLDKANLDLQTKISSDNQTLQNFEETTKTLITSIQLLYEDVITTTDKLLGVSPLRQSENDEFERILGARNTATRFIAESSLRTIIQQQALLDGFVPDSSETGLSMTLQSLKEYVNKLIPLLDQVDTMLTFTDPSGTFSQAQLDGYITQINILQSQTQGQVSSITQQINNIESFLTTYLQSQESVRQSIKSLEEQIGSTKEALKSASFNADIGLENAQNSLNTTIKNKATTEASLLNAITQAQIASNEAQKNLGKLTIKSPIEGTIGDILVDIGQEIAPGTPLFTITSTQQQEIEIALTSDEVARVNEGQSVTVTSDGKSLDATLVSIAKSSNATLGYKAIIRLDENVTLVGSAATVSINLESELMLIPLKYIKILNKDQGQITTWDGLALKQIILSLGKVWGSSIEVFGEISEETSIVTNNVDNYDPNKFTLTPKF